MLKLSLLPAEQGDCLWLEYEDGGSKHRIVIDGGPTGKDASGAGTSALRQRVEGELKKAGGKLHVDLLVVSHIDNDHIQGVLDLLENFPAGLTFGDVWFNAYRHLLPPDRLGPDEGERLSHAIVDRRLPWNRAFDERGRDGKAAVVIPEQGFPEHSIGGMKLTVLGPTRERLAALEPMWKPAVKAHGLELAGAEAREAPPDRLGRRDPWPPDVRKLAASRPRRDHSAPNGSSIVILAELGNRALLLTADSWAWVVAEALERLRRARGVERLRLDACQVPHHGSKANLSNDFLQQLDCRRYLVSTSGKGRSGHPDAEAIARVLVHGGESPELCFNYSSDFTRRWNDDPPRRAPAFTTRYPETGEAGIEIPI